LHDIRQKDKNRNAVSGKNVLTYNTDNCIIVMPDNKLAVLQGLDNYIVVEDDNILLVCRKEDEQQLRQIVSDIKIEKGEEFV